MHSVNIKMISEQMFCLAKMILKQNLLFSIQKLGKQFSLAKGSVEARKGFDFRWHCSIQLKFLMRFKLVPEGSVIRS